MARARVFLLSAAFVFCLTFLLGLSSAFGQQGLVRSQSEAVEGAVRNQLMEARRPYRTPHRWAERRSSGRPSQQQSRYYPRPPRTAVK
jgi:hypothetical protein